MVQGFQGAGRPDCAGPDAKQVCRAYLGLRVFRCIEGHVGFGVGPATRVFEFCNAVIFSALLILSLSGP